MQFKTPRGRTLLRPMPSASVLPSLHCEAISRAVPACSAATGTSPSLQSGCEIKRNELLKYERTRMNPKAIKLSEKSQSPKVAD